MPDSRPWVKLSTDYFTNPKMWDVSNDAKVLHLSLILLSAEKKTDGVVPAHAAKQQGTRALRELLDKNLLEKYGKFYQIHDYLQHQTPAETISTKAAKGAHVRWHVKPGKHEPTCAYCVQESTSDGKWEPDNGGAPIPF